MIKQILYLFSLSFIIYSCSSDDGNSPNDDLINLEEERALTIQTLSNGSTKTWYIVNAELVNENGTFNISNSYNIIDDDFIFSQNGEVKWNPGFDINQNATSVSDVSIDYYLEPIKDNLTFIEESKDEFTLFDGLISLRLEEDNTLIGIINFEGRSNSAYINITLGERTLESYSSPPSEGLIFSNVTIPQTEGEFSIGAAGFIGSYSNNSLYIALRDDSQINGDIRPEVILKYNIDTNTWTESLFYQQDFVTKRLHIINNELIVFGANYVNTYPLNLDGTPPQSFQHNLNMTRFGLAVQGDEAYVTGYNLDILEQPSQIRSYNYLTNNISPVINTLPNSRTSAGSEILNNKLYIFGGRNGFASEDFDAECYIIDLENGNISTFMMSDAPRTSYAAKYQNLIFVGYNFVEEVSNGFIPYIRFGVYNTITGNYVDIPSNLVNPAPYDIVGLTVFNDFIYIIRKNWYDSEDISILKAPLN
tara:strand:- start:28656 stop:30086 length:1431 start_codon:yes stop_codon:yes gene_type:complete